MSKEYICELCKKEFNQKIDFTRHKNKKAPCISIVKIEEIIKVKEITNDCKSKLISIFKNCLDILRDNEHLTGDKALRTLAYLLILRLLESQFGNTIDIENYKYDFSHIEDDQIERHRKKLLSIAKFSNLAKEKDGNIPTNMGYLWDDILAVHPATKKIFLKGKGFDIQHQSTYKKLIDKLNTFKFEEIETDVLGEVYEEVIQDIMTGKVLGQYFTPTKIKKMMIKLIDPQLKKDGTIETIYDPAMGTAGFLISSLKYLITQSKTKNIKMDWNFIKTQGLGGREPESDTYQLAVSNMLIASGHMFDVLEKDDSIRHSIDKKYDIILANPPYGIDGLNYSELPNGLKNEYIPIKTNSAVPLFLQVIIHILKINGRCAVVLPEGQELFSKNSALVAVREYLMKTCDLKEIIYMPSGIFTHTPIKTCVFYFIKKKEGTEIFENKTKISKITNQEMEKNYVFSKTHQTSTVKFYDYNPENEVKNLLVEVEIDKIAENNYSLNYAEYLKDEMIEEDYAEGVVIKTLGEVCNISYGSRIVKKNNIEGEYPVFGSGRAMFTSDIFNREDFNILIGRFALSLECVRFVNKKIFLNDSGLTIKPKNNLELLHKYIGYFLLMNQNIIYMCARGTAQKNLDISRFKKIKIPIPSIEIQEEIITYLDFIYESCIKTSNTKIIELKRLNEYSINMQNLTGKNDTKTLGEVCNFKNGKGIKKDMLIHGEYPVIGGGKKPLGFHNEYNRTENTILCATSGSAGYISKYNKKTWASDCFSIIPKNSIINNYLYYLLKTIQEKIYKLQTGMAQQHIYSRNLENIKIRIPSIEIQNEIVEYCEFNDLLISQLEKEIEQNKKIANLFLINILKSEKTEYISDDEYLTNNDDIIDETGDNDNNDNNDDEHESINSSDNDDNSYIYNSDNENILNTKLIDEKNNDIIEILNIKKVKKILKKNIKNDV